MNVLILNLLLLSSVYCKPFFGSDTTPFSNGKQIILKEFKECDETAGSAIMAEETTLTYYNRTMLLINTFLNVKQTVSEKLYVNLLLSKCDSKQQVDSCQIVMQMDIKDVCAKLHEKGQPWSPFIEKVIDLPPDCPIPPKRYTVEDAPLNTDFLDHFPVINGYYIAQSILMDGEETNLGCIQSEVAITDKRRHLL